MLEYCSSIWNPIFKRESQEIEKVQRRATKIVKQLHHLSYPERLKKLNLTTLSYRRVRTDVLQVYRIINKIDNLDLKDFFIENNHEKSGHDTRGHQWKFFKPEGHTPIRRNTFSHRVIN